MPISPLLSLALLLSATVTEDPVAPAAAPATAPVAQPSRQQTAQLEEVSIDAARDKGYTAEAASAATRTETPLLETPMAIQVVPREVLEDRQIRTALDAVKNVSGVQSPIYQFYDQFLIRGFDSGYGSVFRNGLQLRGVTDAVDAAFVERVEVVKGPASVLYGRIEPGGFVNVVTRAPQAAASYGAEVQAGRWGALRPSVDATGPIDDRATLRYRLMGAWDRSDSWVRNAHRDNKALGGALAWVPGDRFQANLQLEYYDRKTSWLDSSVPVIGDRPARVSRDFSILSPESWSEYPYTTRRLLVSLDWSWAVADGWKLRHRFHAVRSTESQQGVYADGFDGVGAFTGLRFTHSAPGWRRDTYGTTLDLAGEFVTGPLRHRILVGVDWSRFTDDTPGSTGPLTGPVDPIDIHAPSFGDHSAELRALAAQDASNILWRDRADDTGIYAQDQISIGKDWDILAGLRYDWAVDAYSETYGSRDAPCYPTCTGYPLIKQGVDRAFSPRGGLLHRVTEWASVYASYTRSFGTSNSRDKDGHPVPPQVGTQYEVGAKASLAGGRLTATASAFQLVKTNIPQYDPTDFFPRIVGEARSRGLELDLAGQLGKHVSVIGSYTWDQAFITKDPLNGTQGNRLGSVAPHVVSLWSRADTAPGEGSGWLLGVGAYWSARRWGDDTDTWQMPGYLRIDAMVAYRHKLGPAQLQLQLNLENALDATYFEHGGYGVAAYGAPRNLTTSLKVRI